MARRSSPKTYTDPDLRDRIKDEVTAGDRGGKPGQWSARKAQLVAAEYKRAGGGYTTDKADEPAQARHLDEWTDEDWQTSKGSGDAGHGHERYLPRKAWEQLTPEQQRATNRKKERADDRGEQFTANTPAAAKAGRRARSHDRTSGEEPLPGYDELTAAQVVAELPDLDDEARTRLAAYERSHKARKTVLHRL